MLRYVESDLPRGQEYERTMSTRMELVKSAVMYATAARLYDEFPSNAYFEASLSASVKLELAALNHAHAVEHLV